MRDLGESVGKAFWNTFDLGKLLASVAWFQHTANMPVAPTKSPWQALMSPGHVFPQLTASRVDRNDP